MDGRETRKQIWTTIFPVAKEEDLLGCQKQSKLGLLPDNGKQTRNQSLLHVEFLEETEIEIG